MTRMRSPGQKKSGKTSRRPEDQNPDGWPERSGRKVRVREDGPDWRLQACSERVGMSHAAAAAAYVRNPTGAGHEPPLARHVPGNVIQHTNTRAACRSRPAAGLAKSESPRRQVQVEEAAIVRGRVAQRSVRRGAVRSESDVHRSVARCWACLRELGAGILGGRHCNCMSVAQGPRHTIGCVTLRPQGRGRHMRAVRCTRRVSVHSSSIIRSSSVEVVPPYLTGRSRCHCQ